MFVFVFFLPAIQSLLFCLCIGHNPFDLKMGIVNEEIDSSQERTCNYTADCTLSMFSCRFLRFMSNETFIQVCYLILSNHDWKVKRLYVCQLNISMCQGSIQKFIRSPRSDEAWSSLGSDSYETKFYRQLNNQTG